MTEHSYEEAITTLYTTSTFVTGVRTETLFIISQTIPPSHLPSGRFNGHMIPVSLL
jgi:hypothetical protein